MSIIIILIVAALIVLAVIKSNQNTTTKITIGRMFQMLESFNIIDSTTKLDIFTQRLDFLGKLASSLPANANHNRCIDTAIQAYSHKYPSKPISPTIRLILNQPQIAISPKFRDEAATAFYLRTCNQLKAEIKTLKTTSARQRRVIKASELADIIVDRLTSNERQKYVDCILAELTSISDIPL